MTNSFVADQARLSTFVNNLVGHVNAEIAQQKVPAFTGDFIDSLIRVIGSGLIEIVLDTHATLPQTREETGGLVTEAELACIITVVTLTVIACRCVRQKNFTLLLDSRRLFPVGVELADEFVLFISSDMLTEEGKTSNLWARTFALVPSWMRLPKEQVSQIRSQIEQLAMRAEDEAVQQAQRGRAAHDMSQFCIQGIQDAFPASQSAPPEMPLSGCIPWMVALIGLTYWWFH